MATAQQQTQTSQAAQQVVQQVAQAAETPAPGKKYVPIIEFPPMTEQELADLDRTVVGNFSYSAAGKIRTIPTYTVAKGEALVLDDAGGNQVIKAHQVIPDISAMKDEERMVLTNKGGSSIVTTTREDLNQAWYDTGWMRWGAIALGTLVGAGVGGGGTYYALTRDDAPAEEGMATN